MKKIFGLITLLLLMSCDDGDMTFKTFNFGNAAVASCPERGLIYKASGTEVLILDLEPSAFVDIEASAEAPRTLTLNGANRLIYRNYNGNVGSTSLCSDIPPASPTVIEEWNAQPGGTITIVTSKRFNEDGALSGYNHTINLKSITFTKGEETIIIEDNVFGTYSENLPYNFDFLDEEETAQLNDCDINNLLFRVNGSEALVLNVDHSIFPNAETVGTPATYNIATDPAIIDVLFNLYTSSASTTLFCSTTPPITPTVKTQWIAVDGQLQIATDDIPGVPGAFQHVISLINVRFENSLGESFTIGTVAEPYRIGRYETP